MRQLGITLAILALTLPSWLLAAEPAVQDIGDRLELFVDRHMIDSLTGARLVLHPPRPAEIAVKFDSPWDGKYSAFATVFKDGDLFKMYYRGWPEFQEGASGINDTNQSVCYAESPDGIHWTKPNLGLFEFKGAKQNNIAWRSDTHVPHNFTPFKDTRPGVPDDQRYKALNGVKLKFGRGMFAFASPDGLHWRLLHDEPVLTEGAFDSQNLAFWDSKLGKYVAYYRVFIDKRRAVATATSDDFIHWSEGTPVDLGSGELEEFYTNATSRYFRAPHYTFMFPKRYMRHRDLRTDVKKPAGISDALFLSSRDGVHFDRTFREALIRPGRSATNWGDRSTMPSWGLLQTGPDEMSMYYSQDYKLPSAHIRRGVWRLDGIASVHAGYEPGEVVTKPLTFSGKQLLLNFATSAAGSVQVEIQDPAGKPIKGYTLDDGKVLFGDEIAGPYSWKSGSDVSKLAGKPVRLRFVLKDADLYSYRFVD